jgi:hypothetical protein
MVRTRMFLWLVPIAGVGAMLFGIYANLANEPLTESNSTIVLGMTVDTARRVLEKHKIKETLLEYAMSKDTDWLFRQLSPEANVVFAYSKTSGKITEIALYYHYPPYCKGDDVMVSARSIRFEEDGSYVIHCENPKRGQKSRSSTPPATPSSRPDNFRPPTKQKPFPTKYPAPTPLP